ncbi:hypothetical protein [Paraburkholderia tropica]|uniref:hypothetical protein n=1 Tax=Paraburkholderia tropica TaxID=92647 RepID=UPI001CC7C54A|nr:hypothetical protein [Paraburkholderia tropica]
MDAGTFAGLHRYLLIVLKLPCFPSEYHSNLHTKNRMEIREIPFIRQFAELPENTVTEGFNYGFSRFKRHFYALTRTPLRWHSDSFQLMLGGLLDYS